MIPTVITFVMSGLKPKPVPGVPLVTRRLFGVSFDRAQSQTNSRASAKPGRMMTLTRSDRPNNCALVFPGAWQGILHCDRTQCSAPH